MNKAWGFGGLQGTEPQFFVPGRELGPGTVVIWMFKLDVELLGLQFLQNSVT